MSYNEQLRHIIEAFFQQHQKKRELALFLEHIEKWKQLLSPRFADDIIYNLVQNDFIFQHKIASWTSFVKQTRKKTTHPYIRSILKKWNTAQFIIGKVINYANMYVEIVDILTERTVYIYSPEPIAQNQFILTAILQNDVSSQPTYVPTCPFIPLPKNTHTIIDKITIPVQNTTYTAQAFWKYKHFSFWKLMIEALNDEEKTIQNNVLHETKVFLEYHNRDSTSLIEILSTYLQEQQPAARKEEAIVAGAIRFGQEQGLFDSLSMTVKEIAARFSVSPSSLNKYYQDLSSFTEMKYSQIS